jgi:hypothetical protein
VVGLVEAVGGAVVYLGARMIRNCATSERAGDLHETLRILINNILVAYVLVRILFCRLVSTAFWFLWNLWGGCCMSD